MTRRAPVSSQERTLDALYAKVPEGKCKGLCQESCGPIRMSRAEWLRIKKRAGSGATTLRPGGVCPLLTDAGNCSVYSIRPMVCRLWGVVESMPCPWGCMPEDGLLADEEGYKLLHEAGEAGQ